MSRESCGNCRFWKKIKAEEKTVEMQGLCRRHSPRPDTDTTKCALWPLTLNSDGAASGKADAKSLS